MLESTGPLLDSVDDFRKQPVSFFETKFSVSKLTLSDGLN